jgi:hypothetical protein
MKVSNVLGVVLLASLTSCAVKQPDSVVWTKVANVPVGLVKVEEATPNLYRVGGERLTYDGLKLYVSDHREVISRSGGILYISTRKPAEDGDAIQYLKRITKELGVDLFFIPATGKRISPDSSALLLNRGGPQKP